jgi:hypothetical protein
MLGVVCEIHKGITTAVVKIGVRNPAINKALGFAGGSRSSLPARTPAASAVCLEPAGPNDI